MIRRAFVHRILAALGVGAVVGASGKSQWQASPPSPPAPPSRPVLRYKRMIMGNSFMSTHIWDELAQMQAKRNRELARQLYRLRP